MSKLPPRPNFQSESDTYLLWTYRKAIDEQHHIVDMTKWKLPDIKNSRREIFEHWQEKGFGRLIDEQIEYGEEFTHFSTNEVGIKRGKKLENEERRNRLFSRLHRNFLPLFNALAAFIAAVAAVAAAYFSYLALSGN